MSRESNVIYVYENYSTESPIKIGYLFSDFGKGKENYSFEFDKEWLINSNFRFMIDPDMDFFEGRQYVPTNKKIFGLFEDSCPDRWGRLLMKRREMINARKEERKPRLLNESDYLLGVYDETRMGGLRFSISEEGPFLSSEKEMAAPPWTHLRALEQASRAFEEDENSLEDLWLKQLIAPGSSLGGARPKANVYDTMGNLWIAKFPSKHDENNTGAWEMVVHDLAILCNLDVPNAKLTNFSKYGSTFLIKRFDREKKKRIHFSSAMTMLGKTDGSFSEDGTGYLDLVYFLKANGSSIKKDLNELFRRIIFNMAVSNTDDHLRNHGFLLENEGWRLSPLYDVNPVPYGDHLSLNVSETDSTIDMDLAIDTARYYELSKEDAKKTVDFIRTQVNENWKKLAKQYGIGNSEIEEMAPAFHACEK